MMQVEQLLRAAVAHLQAGRPGEAAEVCRQIVALEPGHAVALHLLGVLTAQAGRVEEGIAWIQRAIAARPGDGEFQSNLSKLLLDAGRTEEAIAAGQEAVRLWPAAPAYVNLTTALGAAGRHAEMIEVLGEGCLRLPGDAALRMRMGETLRRSERWGEAEACFGELLRMAPGHVGALNNLGLLRHLRGELDAALALLTRAVTLDPGLVAGWVNLAGTHRQRGETTEAIACWRKAMELSPGDASLHSDLILTLLYDARTDGRGVAEELRRWWRRHGEPRARERMPHGNERSPERRLRIGYVSGDFRDHVVGRQMRHLIRARDREAFEVFCYGDVERADAVTAEFQALGDRYRDIRGMDEKAVAATIRGDTIDILVDLSLHTDRNRLTVLARKPAPVQVTFAGYPGSTGMPTVDYRLSDPYLDPPGGDESGYVEETVRLPETFWVHDVLEDAPAVGPLPALANGYVTFGCLGNFCKVNDSVLALWARVMAAVPGSRLVMLADAGSHRARTQAFLAGLGIGAERVGFVRKWPARREYLGLFNQVDIGLDTLPYGGHMTGLDAAFMGVPVVTLAGETVVGRAGVSQLTNLGLRDLIARTPEEYVAIAQKLAADLPRLAALRAGLRSRLGESPLSDMPKMARGMEAAYRMMWRKWCASSGTA